MKTSGSENVGPIGRGIRFIKESWEELKKVSYPSRQETVQTTTVVLIIMVIVAAFLASADLLFRTIMRSLI